MSLFKNLHKIIMRDNGGMTIVEGQDPRYCAITYHDVQGTDEYRVEYFDSDPQRIGHAISGRSRYLTQGDKVAPW